MTGLIDRFGVGWRLFVYKTNEAGNARPFSRKRFPPFVVITQPPSVAGRREIVIPTHEIFEAPA